MNMRKGFTLVEILIVITLIGILVTMILPSHRIAVVRAKEAVLKENLWQMRDAISKYYQDKGKYPTDLEELIVAKYLRKIPMDPITKRNEWVPVYFEPDEMEDYDPELLEGIIDVKSYSRKEALDGSRYNEW
jgi:general secretion pathway protein G